MTVSPYLVDHLDRADLPESLAELTQPLGKGIGLPTRVDEVGVVCPNVLVAANELKSRWPKMETFLLGQGSPKSFVENGKQVPFTTRVGFGFYKGVILELAEPGIGSNIFGQTPNPEGRVVINHVGFVARDEALERTDAGQTRGWSQIMQGAGYTKRVEAVLDLLGISGHIHIYETIRSTAGIEIEFLDFRLFKPTGPRITFPSALCGAIGWLQSHVGPRFIDLASQQALPPAPNPRTECL